MGKQRLKAGNGKVLRPEVAEVMALTAADIAGCSGIGTKSCFFPAKMRWTSHHEDVTASVH